MGSNEVVVLDFWVSPFVIRVKIALAEKGVEYVSKEENLKNKSSLLLEMNPVKKQVPVLIHNGKPVCESMIIVEYIDELWDHKFPLLPSDPYQRTQARLWADYVDKKIYPLGRTMWFNTGEARVTAKQELIGCYKLLECELGDKPFFGGEDFGFVDVALIPFYSWFYAYEQWGLNMVQECPKIVTWAHMCMEKENVSKVLPDQQKIFQFFEEHMLRHIESTNH